MNDGVMKKFLNCHKFAEIGVPSGRVIHSASPFVIFDRCGFFQKRSIAAVKQFPIPLVRKDPTLHRAPCALNQLNGPVATFNNQANGFEEL